MKIFAAILIVFALASCGEEPTVEPYIAQVDHIVVDDSGTAFVSEPASPTQIYIEAFDDATDIEIDVLKGSTLTLRIDLPTLSEALVVYATEVRIFINSASDPRWRAISREWAGYSYDAMIVVPPDKEKP